MDQNPIEITGSVSLSTVDNSNISQQRAEQNLEYRTNAILSYCLVKNIM